MICGKLDSKDSGSSSPGLAPALVSPRNARPIRADQDVAVLSNTALTLRVSKVIQLKGYLPAVRTGEEVATDKALRLRQRYFSS
ncbi:hypothetical protein ElyMa_005730400 [Elysia marginata]|uniref:Uncharacterized protein n=1 Tax=Elysia marginata TaxID=1093978 RepID=A0AAV4FJE9_9GAST|nr:hypothetical protein ElyMa_005730400 [Elysia marginata]